MLTCVPFCLVPLASFEGGMVFQPRTCVPIQIIKRTSLLSPVQNTQTQHNSPDTVNMRAARSLSIVQLALVWTLNALAITPQNCSRIASVEIEHTLSLFAHLVDTHNYTSLDLVFTPDAVADFATPAGYINGLPTIEHGLQESLGRSISQHALSTYLIKVIDTDPLSATAVTYLQGTFFGQGNETGQYLTSFGS